VRILAISGSLREGSYSTALARAAAEVAPAGVEVELFGGLGAIPPYDPAADILPAPSAVHELRHAIEQSDGVLIVTPEYNGSLPGALKNAIDWASRPHRESALSGKTVAVAGASPGSYGALWAVNDLRRILGIAGARVIDGELAVAQVNARVDAEGRLVDAGIRGRLDEQLRTLVEEARSLPVAA
jgi:chromate reductase